MVYSRVRGGTRNNYAGSAGVSSLSQANGCLVSPLQASRGHHHSFVCSKPAPPCLLYLHPFNCSNKNTDPSHFSFPHWHSSPNPIHQQILPTLCARSSPLVHLRPSLWCYPSLRHYHISPGQQQEPSNPSPHFHTCSSHNPLSESNQSNFSNM